MPTIAIIGAGFTGSMVAAHLLKNASAPGARGRASPLRIVLIDRSGRFGRGVAYGTRCGAHILNVPAGRMSAFEDAPDHFLEWARARDGSVQGGSFVPRMLFGEYVEATLDAAAAASPASLERLAAPAIAVTPLKSGVRVRLATGKTIDADRVVLALGNFPPSDPPLRDTSALADPRYLRDPWDLAAYAAIDPAKPVLLVDTGLTMLDVALELASRNHAAPILAISRRGLLPQPHRSPAKPHHPEPPPGLASWEPTAKGILRALRREVDQAATHGIDWREVVTSIRHDTARLWQMMGEAEKRRFLTHLRAFWDVHRHRAAPQAFGSVQALIKAGRLRVMAARLRALSSSKPGLTATLLPRGDSALQVSEFGAVINCTGPDTDLSRIADPLIASLRSQGLIRPDALGLGLDSTDDGAAIGAAGRAVPWLSIAGPLRRGKLWENTAVPELRIEAAALARALAGEPALSSR
jgi:uncharacterized NAD(P)/FAD-binding protein YdhS